MRISTMIAVAAAAACVLAGPLAYGRRAGTATGPAATPAPISAAVPVSAVSPAVAPPAAPTSTPAFDLGRWELRPRGGGAAQQICVVNIDRLLRLRHEAIGGCEQFALRAPSGQTTVQYTCRGRGYGRTHLRFETARLVQLDTRGVLDGLPFEMSAEARRIGDCTS